MNFHLWRCTTRQIESSLSWIVIKSFKMECSIFSRVRSGGAIGGEASITREVHNTRGMGLPGPYITSDMGSYIFKCKMRRNTWSYSREDSKWSTPRVTQGATLHQNSLELLKGRIYTSCNWFKMLLYYSALCTLTWETFTPLQDYRSSLMQLLTSIHSTVLSWQEFTQPCSLHLR